MRPLILLPFVWCAAHGDKLAAQHEPAKERSATERPAQEQSAPQQSAPQQSAPQQSVRPGPEAGEGKRLAPPAPSPEGASAAQVAIAEAARLVEDAPDTEDNLARAIALYEAHLDDPALPLAARAAGYADLSRAWLRLGDLERRDEDKIAAYRQGKAAGERGCALDPQHDDALFWSIANQAVIGRTRGVMSSLFMLGELRAGLERVLAMNPNHHYARQSLGEIDHAVPGFAGGSDARAEKAYMEILRREPGFTSVMVKLGELYRDLGKRDEAKTWAKKCLATKRPSLPADFHKFDAPAAQALLRELGS